MIEWNNLTSIYPSPANVIVQDAQKAVTAHAKNTNAIQLTKHGNVNSGCANQRKNTALIMP